MSADPLLGTDRVVVDDLTFDDLLALALQDVPSSSAGEWTLHGAVDPGVTLLDAFAWQFEQRLYMGDQLTEPIVRASLRLLGIDEPSPARPAVTALSFSRPDEVALVAEGTVMDLAGDVEGRRIATTSDASLVPVNVSIGTGRLLEPGDVLSLEIDVAAPVVGSPDLSLLFDVVCAPGVLSSWDAALDPGHVDVPTAADLRWRAVGADGARATIDVDDGTGALRRTGVVVVPWPDVWNAVGSDARRLEVAVVGGHYTEAVRVRSVHPNVVIAEHRVPAVVDVSDTVAAFLPLPDQRIRLADAAGLLCDGPEDMRLEIDEIDGQRHTWHGARSWVGVGPADRVVVVDRTRGEVVFGDGQVGRILRPADPPNAQLAIHYGAGRAGTFAPGRAWVEREGELTATNPLAAEGHDPEPVAAAVQRAAGELARPHRTVTVPDTEQLALIPGVARSHARPGHHPGFPCNEVPSALSVTVVPHAERSTPPVEWTPAPQPDRGLLAAVQAELEAGRLIGQEVFALGPVYRRVSVALVLSAHSRSATLERSVRDALRAHLDPLDGGSEGDGWPFGGEVRPSELLGVVQAVTGPEVVVEEISVALDDDPPSSCEDLAIDAAELVWLGDLSIRWSSSTPDRGGLR